MNGKFKINSNFGFQAANLAITISFCLLVVYLEHSPFAWEFWALVSLYTANGLLIMEKCFSDSRERVDKFIDKHFIEKL